MASDAAGSNIVLDWREEPGAAEELVVSGRLDRHSAREVHRTLVERLRRGAAAGIAVDLSGVKRIDASGVALFADVLRRARSRGVSLRLSSLSAAAREAFEVFRWDPAQQPPERIGEPYLVQRGESVLGGLAAARDLLVLCADTFVWAVTAPFQKRPYRKGAALEQSVLLGSNAAGIVALISFIVGLTMALLSATQLRTFGANIYVADMLALAMTRELAPLLTAILVAGRSGSAVAAEVATMKVTEEVDALKTLGLEPVRFLVVPKFYAITLTQPLLTVISALFGIAGGLVIGTLMLNLSPEAFVQQAARALVLKDLLSGLLKSVVFGWIILVVGAFNGFRVTGGAEGVGRVTTSAVVQAIFGVIVADAIFSLIFWYG